MSGPRVRRIDFHPDEYIAGVAGKLTPEEQGVYWLVCSLIYSTGGPIDNDHKWLARMFSNCSPRLARSIIDKLISMGKLTLKDGRICSERALNELRTAHERIANNQRNGREGGRPPKQINDLEKPKGSADQNPNYQLPTTNDQPPSLSLRSRETRAEEIDAIEAEFAQTFWPAYPNKVGKPAAERSYRRARKKHELRSIVDGLRRYQTEKPPDRPWLNPATFLNQERFLDEPAELALNGNGHHHVNGHNGAARQNGADTMLNAIRDSLAETPPHGPYPSRRSPHPNAEPSRRDASLDEPAHRPAALSGQIEIIPPPPRR